MIILEKFKEGGFNWFFKRIFFEFKTPTTSIGKAIRFFNCRILSLIYIFHPALKLINKKTVSSDTLYLFYDLEISPITFDFCRVLIMSENQRQALGLNYIYVVFVPGSNHGLRQESQDYEQIIDKEARYWRQYNILYPLTHLLPSCSGFSKCSTRQEAEQLRKKVLPHIYPKDYNIFFPIDFGSVYNITNNKSPHSLVLRAKTQSHRYIDQWLNLKSKGRKTISITLRYYSYMPKRNSNIIAWSKFANDLDKTKYHIIIVPDTELAMEKPLPGFEDFDHFTPAAWNVELRAALYEKCYLNLGINSGPFTICWFNERCRYICFKIITKEVPQTTEDYIKKQGFILYEPYPFSLPYQKWVWEDDTYEAIGREFNNMCQMLNSHQKINFKKKQDQKENMIKALNIINKEILTAVQLQDLETIKYLHEVQGLSLEGAMPIVIQQGCLKTIKYLQSVGITLKNEELILAIQYNHLHIVKYLHTQGIALNQEALTAAAEVGNVEIVQYIHLNGIKLTNHALIKAAENDQVKVIQYFYKHGVMLSTLVNVAASAGQSNVIHYLHETGLTPSLLSENSIKTLKDMHNEIMNSNTIFHPSNFWTAFGNIQYKMLNFGGEENFKRTINQTYCNFIPTSLSDPIITKIKSLKQKMSNNTSYYLENTDNEPTLWFTWYKDYQLFQGNRSFNKRLYLTFVARMFDYALKTSAGKILEKIEEPILGNPIRIWRNDKLISQDIISSSMEADFLLQAFEKNEKTNKLIIGELGAGYGRLGYILLKMLQCKYIVFDIPPALYVSQWYLSKIFPEKKIFTFRSFENFNDIKIELEQADIAFFTANQLSLFPENYFDAFATISSLHEMRRDQIEYFIKLLSKVTHKILYIKQFWTYKNPYDNIEIQHSEYNFPANYTILKKQTSELNPLFFEMTLRKKENTVSILLCNYNHALYLPEALKNICEQTVPATEIIVIDDGSTDNSLDVINGFAEKFPNIIVLKNEKNNGLLYSINKALHYATSDYIVWASADDLLFPEFIEKNISILKQYPKAGLSFSRLAIFKDGSKNIYSYTKDNHGMAFDFKETPHYMTENMLVDRLKISYLWISGNTVMARREFILKIGGFATDLNWHTDWFSYYVIALRYGACVIPETLAAMRERPNTYSGSGMNNLNQQKSVLKNLINHLKDKKNKDILKIFSKRPCLFSPFGITMLRVLRNNPRHWDLFLKYLIWDIVYHKRLNRFKQFYFNIKYFYTSKP